MKRFKIETVNRSDVSSASKTRRFDFQADIPFVSATGVSGCMQRMIGHKLDWNPGRLRSRNMLTGVWVLVVITLLAGCSTNSLLIRYFYGRMDNNMNERILAYASFTPEQESEIRRAVDDYFLWHRQNELPRYADFLSDISKKIDSGDYSKEQILIEIEKVRRLSKRGFMRSPVAGAASFLKTLSDAQVEEIAAHFKKKDQDFLDWYDERKNRGGDKARLNAIVKNTGRFGIKLNGQQKDIIRKGLGRYRGDPKTRFEIWNRWESEFLDLLRQRRQPGFEQAVTTHLAVYQDQARLHSPEQHLHNRNTSVDIILEVLDSMDAQQKQVLINKLLQTRGALLSIARN